MSRSRNIEARIRHVRKGAASFALAAALLAVGIAGIAGGPGWAAAFPDPPSPEPARIELPALSHRKLDNGFSIYVMERTQSPIVELTLAIPVGSLLDPAGKPGVAGLTARLTRGGTESHTAEELATAFERTGAQLSTSAGLETSRIGVVALSDQLEELLPLVAEIAIHPTFPESEFALRRKEMLAGVKQRADLPGLLADVHARAFYYGAGHPLGSVATESSVQSLSVGDVRAFYEAHWGPEGASLFIIGDVDADTAMQLAKTHFGTWRAADAGSDALGASAPSGPSTASAASANLGDGAPQVRTDFPAPISLDRSRIRFVEKPGMTQVQIRLMQPGIPREDERRLPAQIANYVLGGGGFSSRLMQAVRSESGRTYGISSGLSSYTFDGTWSITTFTRAAALFDTLSLIEEELRAFVEGGVTRAEVQAAKDHIIGSYPMAFETLGGLAARVREATLRGHDMEFLASRAFDYEKVTLDEVNRIIEELLQPTTWSIVLAGDPKVLDGEDVPETIFGVPTEEIERVSWTDPVRGYEEKEW